MAGQLREIAIYDESFEANVDMTADQYKIVKLHTIANQVVLAGVGEGIGILQNKPGAGESAQVRLFGLSRLVTKGSDGEPAVRVTSDANGFGVVAAGAGVLTLASILGTAWTIEEEVTVVLLSGRLRLHA